MLGWNPGTEQEILSMDELTHLFSLEKVSKSGAKFDYEKGKWFNHKYLQEKSNNELALLYASLLKEKGITTDEGTLIKIVALIKERSNLIPDFWEQSAFFFQAPTTYDEKAVQKRWKSETPQLMSELIAVLESITEFSAANTEEIVKTWIAQKEYNMGGVMNAFRLSVVGELKGPHMFDIIAVIGKKETIDRINNALKNIPI